MSQYIRSLNLKCIVADCMNPRRGKSRTCTECASNARLFNFWFKDRLCEAQNHR